jgi:hypothetical protein
VTPETRKWIGRPGMVEAERVAPREWRWRFVGLQTRTWCDWRLAP